MNIREVEQQTVNNIRRLMCVSTCVYPFAILGRDIIGHTLANALLFTNVVIMTVTLSIWCWLNGRITKYKKE